MKNLRLFIYLTKHFDPYGIEHGERVSKLGVDLAVASGIDRRSKLVNDIRISGLIHDIGKVNVPEAVRRQPGKYLPIEFDSMKKHSQYGYEMLVEILNGYINLNMAEIVWAHHENWNGSGYPRGLKGIAIPKGARILRIPDVFDALTHDRVYRKAISEAEAVEEMKQFQRDALVFDPYLFKVFVRMMKAKNKDG